MSPNSVAMHENSAPRQYIWLCPYWGSVGKRPVLLCLQNIKRLRRCSFFFDVLASVSPCLCSPLSLFLLSENDEPTNLVRLWILDRLRRFSAWTLVTDPDAVI